MEYKQIRGRLRNLDEVLPTLEAPPNRPNERQRLAVDAVRRGLPIGDAAAVFGTSYQSVQNWINKFSDDDAESDLVYFMSRARELGANDEEIAQWFGFDRADKVSTILANTD